MLYWTRRKVNRISANRDLLKDLSFTASLTDLTHSHTSTHTHLLRQTRTPALFILLQTMDKILCPCFFVFFNSLLCMRECIVCVYMSFLWAIFKHTHTEMKSKTAFLLSLSDTVCVCVCAQSSHTAAAVRTKVSVRDREWKGEVERKGGIFWRYPPFDFEPAGKCFK